MDGSGRYRVLEHLGWIQADLPESRAPWVAVGRGRGGDAPGLYGGMRVYVGRYLHVETELRLRDEDTVYPMRTRRRMRSGELHYLDHPILGVIIQTRRLGNDA
ncbi:MAG: CsiV family protein [Arhodomonas sp.]|nr:CsiV family protein [Arhodomonas sp.]